jgi:hypothetical protein
VNIKWSSFLRIPRPGLVQGLSRLPVHPLQGTPWARHPGKVPRPGSIYGPSLSPNLPLWPQRRRPLPQGTQHILGTLALTLFPGNLMGGREKERRADKRKSLKE